MYNVCAQSILEVYKSDVYLKGTECMHTYLTKTCKPHMFSRTDTGYTIIIEFNTPVHLSRQTGETCFLHSSTHENPNGDCILDKTSIMNTKCVLFA